jgi:hypothetical protein
MQVVDEVEEVVQISMTMIQQLLPRLLLLTEFQIQMEDRRCCCCYRSLLL